ncbi:hypothetical protein [Sorangium sp. So ce513]|uniref:hypothetical protein n=1 Tax=Sorangium sp. So ce513 TaxID=3133315 RepID=UPI003F606803
MDTAADLGDMADHQIRFRLISSHLSGGELAVVRASARGKQRVERVALDGPRRDVAEPGARPCGEAPRDARRCGEALRDAWRCGEALRDARRCGEALRDAWRCGEALRDARRHGVRHAALGGVERSPAACPGGLAPRSALMM